MHFVQDVPLYGPTFNRASTPSACEKGKNGDSQRSVRCAFLSSPVTKNVRVDAEGHFHQG